MPKPQSEIALCESPRSWNGRVILWDLGGKKYAIEQQFSLRIRIAATNKLALGFFHNGYTSEDPAGKAALMIVTLEMFKSPLSIEERAQIQHQGALFDEAFQLYQSSTWDINVELPADTNEENRIRMAANLPLKITPGANLPLQIRWDGVEGKTLFQWLTDPDSGLRIVLTSEASVEGNIKRKIAASQDKLNTWWKRIAGDASSIAWRGDAKPLVANVISNECMLYMNEPTRTLELIDSFHEAQILAERLVGISDAAVPGWKQLKRKALLEMDWSVESQFQLNTFVKIRMEIQPGLFLLENPDLVEDQSGLGIGLKAIIGE